MALLRVTPSIESKFSARRRELYKIRQRSLCPICFQVFSRKCNLERHLKSTHREGVGYENFVASSENVNRTSNAQNGSSKSSFVLGGFFKEINEVTEIAHKMSTSSQTLGKSIHCKNRSQRSSDN